MNSLGIVSVVCIVSVAFAQQQCKHTSECAAGECCVSTGLGKRLIFFGRDGHCRPEGKEGDHCFSNHGDNIFHTGDMYDFHCPCSPGLECHGEKEEVDGHHAIMVNPRCVSPGSMTTDLPTNTPPMTTGMA